MKKLHRALNGSLSSFSRTRFNGSDQSLSLVAFYHQRSEKRDFILGEVDELRTRASYKQTVYGAIARSESESDSDNSDSDSFDGVKISHPWPEWVDLMECLLKRGYFRGDGNPFRNAELGGKDSNVIRTACLNFARDRYELIRFLSRKDIREIAASGCPSLDRKVVNSGKRLRAHVRIDEGNVCSSCNLRGNCDRAYVKAREDEGGRTVDVMRFLLTFGLDPIFGTVENKPCLNKPVKDSVRILLKEMVEYSMRTLTLTLDSAPPKPRVSEKVACVISHVISQEKEKVSVPMKRGDWTCPKCEFMNFAKNIKCLRCDGFCEEKLDRVRKEQENLPLKKGDWKCEKCNFLNFARNTRCLQCREKPPKRHINPGEWECPSCNYINFRRNMVCLKCDHKRPKAQNNDQENTRSEFDGGQSGNLDIQQQNQNHSASSWRSMGEQGTEHNHAKFTKASGFVDFPIAGGRSQLSTDEEKRERWRSEMLQMSKRVRDDEFRKPTVPRMFDLPNCSGDENMAEWFNPGK